MTLDKLTKVLGVSQVSEGVYSSDEVVLRVFDTREARETDQEVLSAFGFAYIDKYKTHDGWFCALYDLLKKE